MLALSPSRACVPCNKMTFLIAHCRGQLCSCSCCVVPNELAVRTKQQHDSAQSTANLLGSGPRAYAVPQYGIAAAGSAAAAMLKACRASTWLKLAFSKTPWHAFKQASYSIIHCDAMNRCNRLGTENCYIALNSTALKSCCASLELVRMGNWKPCRSPSCRRRSGPPAALQVVLDSTVGQSRGPAEWCKNLHIVG